MDEKRGAKWPRKEEKEWMTKISVEIEITWDAKNRMWKNEAIKLYIEKENGSKRKIRNKNTRIFGFIFMFLCLLIILWWRIYFLSWKMVCGSALLIETRRAIHHFWWCSYIFFIRKDEMYMLHGFILINRVYVRHDVQNTVYTDIHCRQTDLNRIWQPILL